MESARDAQSTCCDMLRPGGVLQPLHSLYKSLNINYSKTTKNRPIYMGYIRIAPNVRHQTFFFYTSVFGPSCICIYLIRRVLTAIEYHYYFSCLIILSI